jgi:hypothetical protein
LGYSGASWESTWRRKKSARRGREGIFIIMLIGSSQSSNIKLGVVEYHQRVLPQEQTRVAPLNQRELGSEGLLALQSAEQALHDHPGHGQVVHLEAGVDRRELQPFDLELAEADGEEKALSFLNEKGGTSSAIVMSCMSILMS